MEFYIIPSYNINKYYVISIAKIVLQINLILGIHTVTLTRNVGERFGIDFKFHTPGSLHVTRLMEGSPAKRSNKIHVGDKIVATNENIIKETDDINNVVNMVNHDDTTVNLVICRQPGNIILSGILPFDVGVLYVV